VKVQVSSSSPFLKIGDKIRAHIIEDAGTILVGTHDADLTPEITRGWGPTILPDGHTIDVCISLTAGAKTLDNLRDHEEIAITFCHTSTYKTVQLKGRFLDSGEPTARDWEAVERQKNILTEQTMAHSTLRSDVLRILAPDLVKLRIVVQQAFEQTPGPGAGDTL
jgi:hypothetical protein